MLKKTKITSSHTDNFLLEMARAMIIQKWCIGFCFMEQTIITYMRPFDPPKDPTGRDRMAIWVDQLLTSAREVVLDGYYIQKGHTGREPFRVKFTLVQEEKNQPWWIAHAVLYVDHPFETKAPDPNAGFKRNFEYKLWSWGDPGVEAIRNLQQQFHGAIPAA